MIDVKATVTVSQVSTMGELNGQGRPTVVYFYTVKNLTNTTTPHIGDSLDEDQIGELLRKGVTVKIT